VDSADGEFEQFVNGRSSALLRTAYLLCAGDRGAAEDLLQGVLERMYPRWRRIRTSPEAYARVALANAAANRWRRKARRVREEPLEAAWAGGSAGAGSAYDAVAGPEQRTAERDLAVRALATVPPRARAVLVLRFFEDMTEAQVASALDCSVGTVKSQTSRGLAKLREFFNGHDVVLSHAAQRTTNRKG
jgi:RNA polymerase sigma-70 factor (sigma-E family)